MSAASDLFWGVTPFGQPSADLVVALARAGAFGVLDLGTSPAAAIDAVTVAAARLGDDHSFGVRVHDRDIVAPEQLSPSVSTVVIAAGSQMSADRLTRWAPRRMVVEVTSLEAGLAAVGAGAQGIVAKGAESGGRVGDVGAFVLLQQLAAEVKLPLWCQGGMGLHTTAAAIAGGATGVVFDTQLTLTRELALPPELGAAIAAMDGSETALVGGHRVFIRPDVASVEAGAAGSKVVSRLGIHLDTELVAAGQDSAFAGPLAKRFHTAGGVVHAVHRAMDANLRWAGAHPVLGVGSPFAHAFGLRYPIAQGPMTRVSDRPDFAAAVAEAGALPFLALALMAPDDARDLLERTKIRLAGHSWGVGVLGFVPPDLRSGQLQAILDVHPDVALIAGGRPSLARPLEEAGIATFLHVPSPGLLELFVREGARRFVFEGRECGGHVGPRSSFVLWEQQITQLLKGDVEGMDVLFAGGIHDGRSAAMVSALAAPLAARGARIGVLMGTAYLFTTEAVATGAIQPPFQQAAVACQKTALLETAPGHTTRCAETSYVRRFTEERQTLEAAGLAASERWAVLEELNLGRLRIAAKGLKRDGDHGPLIEVDHDEQRRDGMYMIGDVAMLRHQATTVAELHQEVSEGAAAYLGAAQPAPPEPAPPLDVAVIGMACLFPGAQDIAEYWANIVAGTSHVREVAADRWDPAVHCSPEAVGPKGTVSPSRWGGFLDPTPFNPMKFGIPPASLGAIEPVQLLSLEVASNALADAGYAEREFDRTRTSVIFGVEGASDLSSAYVFRALAPGYLGSVPADLDEHLPALTEDSFPGVLSNVIAGRIANRLDLGGANFSVDAACAASLAAVHLACQELTGGGSDLVLCGGADLHNGIYDYQLFASVGALSPTGSCKSFDESADGIALGEGVACVVLKRLADATRDGDRIYAVIKGIGASSDGRSLGLTAPRREGQRVALERAYHRRGVSPDTVGLVEAHGTGTVVGDRTELSTLTDFFLQAGSEPGSCALGSVKAQIGHTKCAAGMAGLIKGALALHHAVLPPAAHISRPSAVYDAATSPFQFGAAARPWSAPRRRAGVSAFGFGGSNFHVVLDSHPDPGDSRPGLDHWPAELFTFADDVEVEQLRARVDNADGARLRDLAADQWARRRGPAHHAIVATSVEELRAKLAGGAARGVYRTAETATPSGVAFLFPGQGSQRPGMLADLFVAFPRLHQLLRLGPEYLPVLFPAAPADPARQASHADTRMAQPTLGMAGLAMSWLLGDLGVVPDALAGHSYGEMVALSAAGALSPSDLILLSRARAEAMAGSMTDPGAMVAVGAGAAQVSGLLGDWPSVVVANDNSPRQVVISGPTTDVAEAAQELSRRGVATRPLAVSCGFHSPLMSDAAGLFAAALAEVDVAAPSAPVWSNAVAAPYLADAAGVRQLLVSQVDSPVRFREQLEAMYDSGLGIFVEVGPGRVLSKLVGEILAGRPHRVVTTDVPGVHGVEQLLHAVAGLAVAGVPVSLRALFEGRDIEPLGKRPSRSRTWMIDGHLVRGPDGRPVPGGLRPDTELPAIALSRAVTPAREAPPLASPSGAPQAPPVTSAPGVRQAPSVTSAPAVPQAPPVRAPATSGDPVLLEYLRGLSQVVTLGHDLMIRYLDSGRSGTPPEALSELGSILDGADQRLGGGGSDGAPLTNGAAANGGYPTNGAANGAADVVFGWELGGQGRLPETSTASRAPAVAAPAAAAAWAPEVVAPPAPVSRTRGELLEAIVAVVSDRTGYPVDMLGADLDLEADLSIDSIKRIEIVGDLVARLGLAGADGLDDALVEQLTALKSLAQIVDWIAKRAAEAPSGAALPLPEAPLSAGAADVPGAPGNSGRSADAVRHRADRGELLAAIVSVVSDRTGYPADMLGADLDLEADLSIDSIKRIEIVGDLVARLGLAGADGLDDALVEQLTALKSLAQIVDWIADRTGEPPAAPAAPAVVQETTGEPVPAKAARYVQRVENAGRPPAGHDSVAGRRFLITDDGLGIAPALAELLAQMGADARVATADASAPLDGIIHLGALFPIPATPAEVFGQVLPHLPGLRWLVLVTGSGGTFGRDAGGPVAAGAGLRGMARSLAREYPDLLVRSVDVDPAEAPEVLAAHLLAELLAGGPLVEVGYRAGRRLRLRTVPEPLVQNGHTGIRLGRGDVVLVTGGGRGITAAVALSLARQGCHLELAGRTPEPEGEEDPDTAACPDLASLRRHLAGAAGEGPAALDARCSRLLAQRQVRQTVAAIGATGGSARYHALDVRDPDAVGALVDDVYQRHGRLDGIIHGAGVVEDRLAVDKTVESFARVYRTKVDGARALLESAPAGTRFVVLFGSIAGAFGNRGQVDYAAANEALEAMAWAGNGGARGRVVCIHWGPWAGDGMVSPTLEREFARRGIGLIDPEDGAACLLRELALGLPATASVVVMRAQPDRLGPVDPSAAPSAPLTSVGSR